MTTTRHRKHAEPDLAGSLRILAESIANGTHSTRAHNVCGDCGEWCGGTGGHYYINAIGVGLCGPCADKIGQGPLADAKRMRGIK